MTNESKVVAWRWRSPHMIAANEPPNVTGDEALIAKVNGQGWEVEGLVTHADYRALEEHFLEVCTARNEWYECAERLKAQNEKLHQDINLIRSRAGDLAASAIAARRELQSCQSVIHLHGGFDPAYIEGAQKAMSDLSASLEALK